MAQVQQELRQNVPHGSPLALAKKAEELRGYPRLDLNISATFRNGAGQRCKGQVANISPDGLQVLCNSAAGQLLHPNGGRICPSNMPIVQISMNLPIGSESKRLTVGAQLLYVTTRESDPNCVLGFKFLKLRPTATKIVENFFAESLSQYFDEQPSVAAL